MTNPLDELDLSSGSRGRGSSEQAVLDLLPEPDAPELAVPEAGPLVDLPLAGSPDEATAPAPLLEMEPSPEMEEPEPAREGTAPLRSRLGALAADFAFVLLLTAAPLLVATAGPARSLAPSGLWWTAGFAIYLSFFATVIPLSLFGKTVGMALTGLDARGGAEMPPLTFVESSRRWVGTFAAVAGLGVPLLVGRQPGLPSLADRLSGRPVVYEEVDSP
jgi:hypothetical protein